MSRWWQDWQHPQHATSFDFRATLDRRNLIRDYESFNDVQLLVGSFSPSGPVTFLEVGCATGEFHRYLGLKYPEVQYWGLDISRPAIERARLKYPLGSFVATEPGTALVDTLRAAGLPTAFDVVYAKDVIHHQTRPYEFLAELLALASETVVVRVRTRDVGPTETDPERSCQYHYEGWMPYIVMNLPELLDRVKSWAPDSEVIVRRSYTILGGRESRFLPRECYLPETGTAETAVAVRLRTSNPGRIVVEDRSDGGVTYTLDHRLRRLASRAFHAVGAGGRTGKAAAR